MAVSGKSSATGRPGRRPGTSTTRQAILDAARARFAEHGYGATTIRTVAEDAGVDASLVMQFFRSKEELFAAVMSLSPVALEKLSTAFDGPDDGIGERVVRAFLSTWEGEPELSEPLMATLRGAIVNERARAQLSDFIQGRLLEGAAATSGDTADATLRAGLAASMLVGLVVGRRVVGVPVLANAEVEQMVSLVAPAIQSVLTNQAQPSQAAEGGVFSR